MRHGESGNPKSTCVNCGEEIEHNRTDRLQLVGMGVPWWSHTKDNRIYCGQPEYGQASATPVGDDHE